MIRINDVIDQVSSNNPDADINLINQAYVYSARVHDGQMRLSGEPYLSHPLEVSGILAEMRLDAVSIAAGLLHDVIEDTHATPEEIKKKNVRRRNLPYRIRCDQDQQPSLWQRTNPTSRKPPENDSGNG